MNTTLEEKRRLALIELVNYAKENTTKKESEFTAIEFAEMIGRTEDSTKGLLKKMERVGKVTSRIIIYNGTTTRVYEPILPNDQ